MNKLNNHMYHVYVTMPEDSKDDDFIDDVTVSK